MSFMPSTLAVSGGASIAFVGLYLVRSVLERIGKGAVEAVHNPSFRVGERDPLNPCPYHLPVSEQEIEPVRTRMTRRCEFTKSHSFRCTEPR